MGGTQTIRWKEGGDSSLGWRQLQQRADARVRVAGTGNREVEEKLESDGQCLWAGKEPLPRFCSPQSGAEKFSLWS